MESPNTHRDSSYLIAPHRESHCEVDRLEGFSDDAMRFDEVRSNKTGYIGFGDKQWRARKHIKNQSAVPAGGDDEDGEGRIGHAKGGG